MKTINFVLIALAVFSFTSCKKSNINDYPDLVGDWLAIQSADIYEIKVGTNGKTCYKKETSNSEESHRGKLIVNENELKIGLKKLTINDFPELTQLDNIWRMTVNEIEYIRN